MLFHSQQQKLRSEWKNIYKFTFFSTRSLKLRCADVAEPLSDGLNKKTNCAK